jgi:hypothetical protein
MKNNPFTKLKQRINNVDVKKFLAWLGDLCILIGASLGIVFLSSMIYSEMNEQFQSWIASTILTVLFVILILIVTDFGYRQLAPTSFTLLLSFGRLKNWRSKVFAILLFALVAGMASWSLYFNINGRDESGELLTKKPSGKDPTEVKLKISADNKEKIAMLEGQIKDISSRISAFNDSIAAKEKEVILSNRKLVQMSNSGSEWAPGKLREIKSDATEYFRSQLESLNIQLAEKQRIYDNVFLHSDNQEQKLLADVMAENARKQQEYQKKLDRKKGFIGYLGLYSVLAGLLITFMRSLIGETNAGEIQVNDIVSLLIEPEPKKADKAEKTEAAPHEAPGPVVPVKSSTPDSDRMVRYLARQNEQLSEVIDKLSGELSEIKTKVVPTSERKPLSDKDSTKKVVGKDKVVGADKTEPTSGPKIEVVGKEIQVDGKIVEISKFKDNAQKWFNRQYTSSTQRGKASNAQKWKEAKPALKKLGCKILPGDTPEKVKIKGPYGVV